MAQKVQVILLDDLDGGEAEETVSFGLDGTNYEIDLSKKNAAKLRDAISPFIASARKAGGSRRSRGGRGGRSSGGRSSADTAAVREWAREQGLKVSDRGRIPADILEKYEASR
ncbi:histone-like nucleoid-structuring protein Lsr2 [Phytoactinopolyspora halotolerans]|uniref:Lsr2 family protein n=1 Tax=Phytoactinopolyspora halotolerans TaxID=1981512 RepID=A0A6L9S1D3_9ACTN|nr:Lsr2 family protein [Phytoactinopolyspora halotolerans]NED98862.1 Lsr2 family protein [Phytoactinopolyspora halotolerans]